MMNEDLRDVDIGQGEKQRIDRLVQREAHRTSVVNVAAPYRGVYLDDVQLVEWRDDHEQIVRHTFFLALGQKKPLREAVRLRRILEGLVTVLADHQPVVQHIAGNFVRDDEDGFVAVSLDRVASAFHCE